MAKLGEQFVSDMWDRGRRELAGALFHDSNIAQPMYPLRGGYAEKATESPAVQEPGDSMIDDRIAQIGPGRDDPGKEDRGIERD